MQNSRGSIHDWVIFISATLVLLTNTGLSTASGTLFPYILEELQESRASTAAIQSIHLGVGMCSGKNRLQIHI